MHFEIKTKPRKTDQINSTDRILLNEKPFLTYEIHTSIELTL